MAGGLRFCLCRFGAGNEYGDEFVAFLDQGSKSEASTAGAVCES